MRIVAVILNIALLGFVAFCFSMMRVDYIDLAFVIVWSVLPGAPLANLFILFRTFRKKQTLATAKAIKISAVVLNVPLVIVAIRLVGGAGLVWVVMLVAVFVSVTAIVNFIVLSSLSRRTEKPTEQSPPDTSSSETAL